MLINNTGAVQLVPMLVPSSSIVLDRQQCSLFGDGQIHLVLLQDVEALGPPWLVVACARALCVEVEVEGGFIQQAAGLLLVLVVLHGSGGGSGRGEG